MDALCIKISASRIEKKPSCWRKRAEQTATYRQVDLSRHSVELQAQGILGAGQGGETSRPVRRQGAVARTADAPVHPKDPSGVLSQAAAVLHRQADLLHLDSTRHTGHVSSTAAGTDVSHPERTFV